MKKRRMLSIICSNHRNIDIILEEGEEVRQIGKVLVIVHQFAPVYNHSFYYEIVEGDAWHVGEIPDDVDFIDKIGNLSAQDLEKVKNFCTTAGLIQ